MENAQSLLSWLAKNTQKEKEEKENAESTPNSFVSFVQNELNTEKEKEIKKDGEPPNEAREHAPGCTQLPITIAYGFDACPHCQSSWITEHTDSINGGVYLRCWSCRGQIEPYVLAERVRINAASAQGQRRLLPWN